MREIKFRGKKFQTGEWIYQDEPENDATYYPGCGKVMKEQGDDAPNIYWTQEGLKGLAAVKINPITIGQDTGLKDTDGKEIFEGDVLDVAPRTIMFKGGKCSVEWDNYFSAFVVKHYDRENRPVVASLRGYCNASKVIGNIYDNPELMQSAKQ